MKRLMFLLLFGLCVMVATAGYSDSGVTKETITSQGCLDQDFDLGFDFNLSMEIEKGTFDLNSPFLGKARAAKSFLLERSLEGFIKAGRAPPDFNASKIRVNYIKRLDPNIGDED
jgi:hypothetical protein